MPTLNLLDHFEDLWDTSRVGNPYHGKVENGVLTLPNAETIPWPYESGRACTLVQLPNTPSVTTSAADAAKGLRWDNYALLQGLNGTYPSADGQLIAAGWTYRDLAGGTWRLRTVGISNGASIEVYAYPLTAGPASEVLCATIVLPVPTYNAAYPKHTVCVVSKDGKKALAHTYQSIGNGVVTENIQVDVHNWHLAGIVELTVTGGEGARPNVNMSAVKLQTQLYTLIYPPSVLTPGSIIDVGAVDGNGVSTGTITHTNGSISDYYKTETVLCACYDNASNVVVFTYVNEVISASGGSSASIPYVRPPARNVVWSTSGTSTTTTRHQIHIEGRGEVVGVEAVTITNSGGLNTVSAGDGSTYQHSYNVDKTMSAGVVGGSSWSDTTVHPYNDFASTFQPSVLSSNVVGLVLAAPSSVKIITDPLGGPDIVIPADTLSILAVASPLGGVYHGVTNLIYEAAPAENLEYPQPQPHAAVHPLTGEFAYGLTGGFV